MIEITALYASPSIDVSIAAAPVIELQAAELGGAAAARAAAEAANGYRNDAETAALAAEADANAAQAYAVQTAADRVQTEADRTQTGLDRVQTGLDAAATAADRIQTGLDAAATAADRIQTGTDAVTASAQAGVATTKAGEAAGSATAAANTYTAFDKRYLGAKAAAPTLDNQGAALQTGALYWDTGLNALRQWTGSQWTNTSDLDTLTQYSLQLLEHLAYVTDMALLAVRERDATAARLAILETYSSTETDARVLADTQLMEHVVKAVDLAGQAVLELAGLPTGVDRIAAFMAQPMDLVGVAARTLAFCIKTVGVPANALAPGQPGDFARDANYLYSCTAANTWKRVAISTW